MAKIIKGRRLGTGEQVEFEYDPTRGNSYGVPKMTVRVFRYSY
ncbi:hypothetical protein QMA67_05875 [Gluconobacter japonicus]|nr:hypothetical protein [Gluconobacter japonicus]MDI6652469.1 hypothetical protein [Gluconobacter japonicus]